MTARDLSAALCIGLSWLFDSTDRASHREAAKICAACPVRTQCREHVREVHAAATGVCSGGGPSGTWAGMLLSKGSSALRDAS